MKDIKFSAPAIAPLPKDDRHRPFWSVMIPVYNPPLDYLEQTLRSVLTQDFGPEHMQIEIVDDCSPRQEWVEIARKLGGGRLAIYHEPKNRGLAATWNRCIERARGQWVHILHQDDLVFPGFYARLESGLQTQPQIGAAFCRHVLMEHDGHWWHMSELHRRNPGILENWLEQLGTEQLIQTPAIVVKRSTYEAVGGFSAKLRFALDWEMWQRIAARFPFWFEPQILAAYRMHQQSETARLVQKGDDAYDIALMLEMTRAYHQPSVADQVVRRAKLNHALLAAHKARALMVNGNTAAAWRQLRGAFHLSKAPRMWGEGLALVGLYGRLAGSRGKRFLKKAVKQPVGTGADGSRNCQ